MKENQMNFKNWLSDFDSVHKINLNWKSNVTNQGIVYFSYLDTKSAVLLAKAFEVAFPEFIGDKSPLEDESIKSKIGFSKWNLTLVCAKEYELKAINKKGMNVFFSKKDTEELPPNEITISLHVVSDELRPDGNYPEDYYAV